MNDMNERDTEGQGYLPGPSFGGGSGGPTGPQGPAGTAGPEGPGGGNVTPPDGYGTYPYAMCPPPPPPPPRPSNHKRALVITGVAALALGAAAGGLANTLHTGSSATATATSKTSLTASQIAARVDPGLADVISTDGDTQPQATSYGTGIVLTSTGEILTNNHVIEGATSIKVIDIGNGKTYTAKVVGYDAGHDVAVIQLENASGLTTATLGNSSTVAVGNTVTALGNAEGKDGTPSVATGTVTGLDQSVTASDDLSNVNEQLTGLIESDAPIQPGDSGGSLVNAYGQVVGMDTAASSSYQFQGTGDSQNATGTAAYTIPINQAVQLAQDIESGNAVGTIHIGASAFMGVSISNEQQNGYGQQASGVYLQGVVQGDPAANAGLTAGDTITSLGGQTVSSTEDIQRVLVKYHPGDSIQVAYVDQDGQQHTTSMTLTSGPAA
jgi:S1-C subfamily serine protease